MKVNYDQKYVNPNKQTNGVRQILATSRPAEDSNLKAYYNAQGQSRLKVHHSYRLTTFRLLKSRRMLIH